MKQVLLFLAIMTVCGSLMKAPVYRMCETSIVAKYYHNGKVVRVEDHRSYINIPSQARLTEVDDGSVIMVDSVLLEPKYSTYRMLK